MKVTAIVISLILLTFATKEAQGSIRNYVKASSDGENSNVNVNIRNNFGSGTNTSTNSVQGESTTRVDIDQEGDGTSSVNINGKEYKVEGTGSLHINEKTNDVTSPTPSVIVTPTSAPSIDQNSSDSELNQENRSFLENLFAQLRESLNKLFSTLF